MLRIIGILSSLIIFILLLSGCESDNKFTTNNPSVPKSENFVPYNKSKPRLIHSQTVYVPVYSSITRTEHTYDHLSTILSIRNISLSNEIIVSVVDYYDTNGKLLRHFIDKPFELGKMASKDFIIPVSDLQGGTGANFIVKWETETLVSPPLIETVMVGILGTQGFGFTSRATEISATFK